MSNLNRRDWLKSASLMGIGLTLSSSILSCVNKGSHPKTLLLVSGWQDVNIGDIAHTPGLLNVLQTFLPKTKIILWKRSKSEKVKTLLYKNFPNVKIIYGNIDKDYKVDSPEVIDAFETADVMVHGSGPYVVGKTNLEAWVKYSNKPFGVFGVTIQQVDDSLLTLLKKASFIYTRETLSIDVLKKSGITGDHISFAPDATFFLNIYDDATADSFLKSNGLVDKKFICAIPRLRYTPYHKFKKVNWTEEKIQQVEEVNALKKEEDHAKMREAMIAWVRETGNKVLICPEMTYQVDIMDELLIDPLPDDVKPFVIKRGYWLPDEAASVYAKAHTLLSFECHSPIIAAVEGTPMFYLRQPEDTIKGNMYYDLGFDDWVFEIEETDGKQIADALRKVWQNYEEAKSKLKKSRTEVEGIYKRSTEAITILLE